MLFLFESSAGLPRQINQYAPERALTDQCWESFSHPNRNINRDNMTHIPHQTAQTTVSSHPSYFPAAHPTLLCTGFLPSQNDTELPWPSENEQPNQRHERKDEASQSPSSSASLPFHRERKSCHRVSKQSQRVAYSFDKTKDMDSTWLHWPSICLEDRLSAHSSSMAPSVEKSIVQLRWGSDSAFVSDQFVPSSKHQLSHTHATDTWLAWITSIASYRKNNSVYEGFESDSEPHAEDLHDNSNDYHKHKSISDVRSSVLRFLPDLPIDMQREQRIPRRRRDLTRGGQKLDGKQLRILQEERKKEIHNISERKRREQVNKGFADICCLVPGLDIKTHTRKQILFRTAEWLQEFLQGNEDLKKQLQRLNTLAE